MSHSYAQRMFLCTSCLVTTLLAGVSPSAAQAPAAESVPTEYVQPPAAVALPAIKETRERFTLNVKVGMLSPVFPYLSGDKVIGVTALVIEPGITIGTSGRAHLIAPVETAQFSDGVLVMASIGLQYDVALPVRNLYLTPRISLGGWMFSSGPAESPSSLFGVLIEPAIGIKYVIRKHLNLGLDVTSLPITFGAWSPVQVDYQMLGYMGVNI